MEIKEMTMTDIEERKAAIKELISSEDADLDALTAEVEELNKRAAELKAAAETRQALVEEVLTKADTIKTFEEEIPTMEEKRTFGVDSAEYREAFYAVLGDYATQEQRDIVVDTTNPGGGDAIAIPKTLDTKIWDGIHTAHPILADVATVRSGIALEVTKHTAIAVRTTKKLDSADTPAQESNTFVKVTLYGYDYEKYVQLTYAEAKMSQGALEDYLAEEIAAELGEALAKDVFAQILTDAGTGQRITPDASSPDLFADLKSALALATVGGAKVIYAPSSKYYEIVGAVNSGVPFNMAATLGCVVKLDNAATKVTVVDPKAFVLNIVQDTLVESDKDVKAHKVVVSGYLRAQGCLRQNKAAAYIN